MVLDKIKELLGIRELKERITHLETQKSGLESRVIHAEKTRALIKHSVDQAELDAGTRQYLQEIDIPVTQDSADAALAVMEAAQVVERYGFERFVPPGENTYPTQVISLKELQEHPELYFHKLSKGFMGFPVGLNFDGVNKILYSLFGNCEISTSTSYSNNGTFDFILTRVLGRGGEARAEANELLIQATALSDLERSGKRKVWDSGYVQIDSLDFLANYDGLVNFILERPGLRPDAKRSGVQAMQIAKVVFLTALEIAATTRIKNASELLGYQPDEIVYSEETSLSTQLNIGASLKQRIKDSLLFEPKGTSYEEIQKLLPIRSKERFRSLASERTSEILSRDQERKGLTHEIGKPLAEYSIGESMVLACYFARNIITKYQTLEDSVKAVLSGESCDEISGKCTDYTGLALHYLREYLVPLHPEKFENWTFGFDKDVIGDYRHCYMKAIHMNPDQTLDVYFVDPTTLANKGIDALKTPEKVVEAMDASKNPVMIQRDAEDLLYKTQK